MSSAKQPYTKPHLSFSTQAERLIERGLIAHPRELTDFLKRTNYYRFSSYLYPFRQANSHNFQPNTEFSHVLSLYNFDHELRVTLFNALTILEVSMLRTHFVEFFTQRYDAMGYVNLRNFHMESAKHEKLLKHIKESVTRSREEFVQHFQRKYSDDYLPLWMAVEVMSFGNVMTMVCNMQRKDKKDFAEKYGITYKVMESWVKTLHYIRNCCAHHARLWNRALAVKPRIPDQEHRPEFHSPKFYNSRIFAVLAIMQYLLKIIDSSNEWKTEILNLLERFPDVPIEQMGFPADWQTMSLWNK